MLIRIRTFQRNKVGKKVYCVYLWRVGRVLSKSVREDLIGMTANFPKSVIPLWYNIDGTVLTGRRHEFTPVLLLNHGPHISWASLVV